MSALSSGWGSTTTFSSQYGNAVVPSAGDLALAPDKLDPDAFRSWTTAKQLEYLGANGAGAGQTLTIGSPGGERIEVSIASKARLDIVSRPIGTGAALSVPASSPSRAATSAELLLLPAQLDPVVFLAWNRSDQDSYLVRNGKTVLGETLAIGNDSAGRIDVTVAADVAIKGSILSDNGRASEIPYFGLDGSSLGTPASGWRAQAEALFPTVDGVTHTLSVAERPTGFYTDPATLTNAPGSADIALAYQRYQEALANPDTVLETTETVDNLKFLGQRLEAQYGAGLLTKTTAERNAILSAAVSASRIDTFLGRFGAWPSQYQLEFVKSRGSNGVLVIPTSGTPSLSVFVSRADPTKLILALAPGAATTRDAIAKMAKVDQDFLTTSPSLALSFAEVATKAQVISVGASAVTNVVSTATPKETVPAATAAQNLIAYIEAKKTTQHGSVYLGDIETSSDQNPATAAETAQGISYLYARFEAAYTDGPILNRVDHPAKYVWHKSKATPVTLPAADLAAFTSQLAVLKEQLAGMGIVSPGAIEKRLSDLKDRFDRAFAFYDVKLPIEERQPMGNPNEDAIVYRDVISFDDNATINRGYLIFISQEKQIAELVESRMQLVRDNGALFGKKMDVPELVYRFQSLYSLQVDAQTIMETEEINQQNALLKTYGVMQDILNRTLANFEKAGGDQRVRILGRTVDDLAPSRNKFTKQEILAMSMFEDQTGKGQRHPLETLRNIDRKMDEIFLQTDGSRGQKDSRYDLVERTYMQWNGFSTALSERVTRINQSSQIKMNDVTSLDKQANRHFDLANSALSKMNEMLNNIARAG